MKRLIKGPLAILMLTVAAVILLTAESCGSWLLPPENDGNLDPGEVWCSYGGALYDVSQAHCIEAGGIIIQSTDPDGSAGPGRTFVVYMFSVRKDGVTYAYVGKASREGYHEENEIGFHRVMTNRYSSGWRTAEEPSCTYTSREMKWWKYFSGNVAAQTGSANDEALREERNVYNRYDGRSDYVMTNKQPAGRPCEPPPDDDSDDDDDDDSDDLVSCPHMGGAQMTAEECERMRCRLKPWEPGC